MFTQILPLAIDTDRTLPVVNTKRDSATRTAVWPKFVVATDCTALAFATESTKSVVLAETHTVACTTLRSGFVVRTNSLTAGSVPFTLSTCVSSACSSMATPNTRTLSIHLSFCAQQTGCNHFDIAHILKINLFMCQRELQLLPMQQTLFRCHHSPLLAPLLHAPIQSLRTCRQR